jgi:hypothetical protein
VLNDLVKELPTFRANHILLNECVKLFDLKHFNENEEVEERQLSLKYIVEYELAKYNNKSNGIEVKV